MISSIYVRLVAIIVLLCGLHPALADTLLKHRLIADNLVLETQQGTTTIQPLSNHAVAVLHKPSQTTNKNEFPSYALANATERSELPKNFTLSTLDDGLQFASKELQIKISTRPFNIQFWQGEKRLVQHDSGFFEHRTLRGIRFKLQPHEKIFGGGQRVLGMDRRGHRLALKSQTDWGYTDHSDAMYYSLPAILSSHGYGILFDNSAVGHVDIGKSEADILQFEAVSGRNAYILVSGQTLPEVTENIVSVTGKQPLPPRWALGNMSSRFGYRTEQEVRDVVQAYQAQDFPLDAIILDLYWFGKDIKGHMGSLDWDRDTFPTGEKMISDLIAQDIKTILITEPFFINTSKQWQSGIDNDIFAKNFAGDTRIIDMYFGKAGLIDVFQPHAKQWFWQHYQRLFSQGMAAVWGDLGEPEAHPENTLHLLDQQPVTANEIHNVYGHEWARLIAENYREFAPNQRLFMLMRSGFLGSQRFGMMPWTGDVSRSWGGLAAQVELSLQMSLFGLAYTHSDLGGFAGYDQFDAELYIRWLQYGVFQPIYRLHGIESVPSEPIYHDNTTQNRAREAIQWRYRLLPYHYTMAYQNSVSGKPLMRPHFFDTDAQLNAAHFANKDSYFWGDAFWVHPITSANTDSVAVTLPSGTWFNFWNDKRYAGNQQHTIPVTKEAIPVFVKAGSFVPLAFTNEQRISNTTQYRGEAVTLHYYHHDSVSQADSLWYEDDGVSADAIKAKKHRLFLLKSKYDKKSLTLSMQTSGNGYAGEPRQRQITWVIHHLSRQPKQVLLGDKMIEASYHADQNTLKLTTTITLSAETNLINALPLSVHF